ncbi:uncharacterized protein LOC124951279 [Vespa velutina]|uniref:uncharacterized protein LOC124951279 n=1 Tax=Vespa velutina TaxID=202808 RepID=UPI001FB44F1F|nr:uncharacterized protein LOC124951279 [Vespa velutina]
MKFSLACFKGRRPQSEKKVPLKVFGDLVLNNYVSHKASDIPNKGCLHEMAILLTCLREKEYNNFDCKKELLSFEQCNQKFANMSKNLKIARLKTVPTPNSKDFSSKQIGYLLNLYPTR